MSSFKRHSIGHDLESILALHEADAVLVSGGGSAQGAAAIRDAYRGILATRPTIGLQTLEVFRAGDLAMLHGKWILHESGADGKQIRREGQNTEKARLQPDGHWLFVIDDPYGGRIGGRVIGITTAEKVVEAFLTANY